MTNNNEIGWNFDNSYARLPQTFFSKMKPNPVSSPELVILNEPLAKKLGLNIDALASESGVEVLAGCKVPEDAEPLAQAYAGHQFGHFNMLGDGRAMLIGEQITPGGERFDIQLKGSGRTPFSRGGDGRAALGPMLREYIISEAMHALGIPTTRSLAVVTTGEAIIRETELPGAILTRVADSHIRVGTFQYAANWRPVEELKSLAEYTIQRHYPKIQDDENPYLSHLKNVIQQQAWLIAKWQHIGFIHGVMNTDNMTISGETIDYGPCAFMDKYDLATVFSSIDREGRYAYGNQPYIGGWNLARFAETLLPLLHDDQEEAIKIAQGAISEYNKIYQKHWLSGMRAKLGIFNEEDDDEALITGLLKVMQKSEADYTNTFRALTLGENTGLNNDQEFASWHDQWQERLTRQKESKEEVHEKMKNSNPSVIPRNHRVEEALEAAVNTGDYSVMKKLLAALEHPYAYTKEQEEYCKLPEPSGMPHRTYCGT
ncbi:MAG: protein adenylyltransferase SelO [Bacillota bacterium]